MTNEEIQKLMEFILTGQAASEAWLQRFQGSHDQITRDILMMAERQSRVEEQAEHDRRVMREIVGDLKIRSIGRRIGRTPRTNASTSSLRLTRRENGIERKGATTATKEFDRGRCG